MGGGGRDAGNAFQPASPGVQTLNNRANLSSNPGIASILSDYGTGKLSLQDAQTKAQGLFGGINNANKSNIDALNSQRNQEIQALKSNPDSDVVAWLKGGGNLNDKINAVNQKYDSQISQYGQPGDNNGMADQFNSLITTNPLAAQRYGTDELQNNQLTSGLFGKGGMQDQATQDASNQLGQQNQLENEINSGDWQKINEKDNTIYGQMSGDLARQTGQQEQQLSQMLGDRGLGAAGSGAAVQGISGIYGNKMEQLGQLQQNLVQQKMNNALQSFQTRNNIISGALGGDRQTATNLGALGQTALSNLFNRNMAGRNTTESEIANANNQKLQNQQAYQGQLNTQFNQNEATRPPSGAELAEGLGSSVAGGFAGGFGTGLGGKVGKSLFS